MSESFAPTTSLSLSAPRVDINPWVVALTVTLATFMELLDTSIANVALPYIGGGLGRSYDEVTWILTTYLVAHALILPMSAWLSRVFGRKTYYLGCVALFTLTSLFCGLAPSLGIMLSSRVLQGLAGGGLAPVSQAILVDTFPPTKRASAFALYTIVIVTAPAIGPVLGGWITDNYNWRWIFFINIPIGLLSFFLSSKLVKDPPAFDAERASVRTNGKLHIDGIGITLIALASAALEIALDRGQIDDWFGSSFICWMLAISIMTVGAAMWYYSTFTLATDYSHYALARAYQGLGYGFFFVPVNVLAYSQLRPDQNNKASSLTNLFRNWGGSFGIAFITTAAERRHQFHQTNLGSAIGDTSQQLGARVTSLTNYLVTKGFSWPDAASAAHGYLYQQLQRQVSLLSFMDCFRVISWLTLAVVPLLLLVRRFKPAGKSPAAH